MTHHDFDLSEVLGALQSDESGDLVRQMVSFLYQALIDAEATEVVQGPCGSPIWAVTNSAFPSSFIPVTMRTAASAPLLTRAISG